MFPDVSNYVDEHIIITERNNGKTYKNVTQVAINHNYSENMNSYLNLLRDCCFVLNEFELLCVLVSFILILFSYRSKQILSH